MRYTTPLINKCLLVVICNICSLYASAQGESNIWYFGNGAGLDFNSGNPMALNNGSLYTTEGCATMSDKAGNLLFYTNGVTVWNAQHVVMSNGKGLIGNTSATQSALIIPKPGSSTRYYIFTVGEKAARDGIAYSVVDMSASGPTVEKFKNNEHYVAPDIKVNLGEGQVIEKNTRLFTPATEKLAAVRHSNGMDYWVIAHQWNSNAFMAIPLTASGIGKPVITKIGLFHGDASGTKVDEAIGYLKPSPDGKKIASVMCYKDINNLEIMDFDNSDGTFLNNVAITTGGYAYGMSFSPDNTKLYVSFLEGPAGVIQYSIPVNGVNSEAIIGSATPLVPNEESYTFGALQIGPDGKLYVAKTGSKLDVINNPNAKGKECKYELGAVSLDRRYSTYGLPNNIATSSELSLGNDTVICDGPLIIDAPLYEEATYLWSTGETAASIEVATTGTYKVQIYNNNTQKLEVGIINVKIDRPPVVNLGNDTSTCAQNMVLSASNGGASYQWSTGEVVQSITIRKSGTYWVEVTKGACTTKDEIEIIIAGAMTVFSPLKEEVAHKAFNNTTFYYSPYDMVDYNLKIYKGKKLKFESRDISKNWDLRFKDKEVKKGEYRWVVNYISRCEDNKAFNKEGILTIMEKSKALDGSAFR
ncbi:MAG TPA: hypothetical protein EYN41_09775 [Flavobacteriales bacterium]|nr:hypothetical protein [Flavobacteriales bacterium]